MRNCSQTNTGSTAAAPWSFITHSDQFLPEVMQSTRAIKYLDEARRCRLTSS